MRYSIFILSCILFLPISLIETQGKERVKTFTNPVLWSDFPDPDAIRVGDTYYMVSTSMHYFPGVTVLESKDLVNWVIASNAVPEFKEHPYYDMNKGLRYARGQWASSIRFHQDTFYVLFNTLDEGAYICTSKSARGPWKLNKIDGFLYDPGLFFDPNGQKYVIHGNTTLFATKLTDDGLSIKSPQVKIYEAHRSGLEGNHCYYQNGYYYIFCTYGGAQGNQVCLRSKQLYGPYEEKVILNDDANLCNMYLHQGCLVDTPEGEYWSLIFQDRVGLGRIPFLVPITWIDNWPILGNSENGNITLHVPETSSGKKLSFPTSDEFNSTNLGLQWQFNHNPDNEKYSLVARKGHLRLTTATQTDSLRKARNTMCQRIFGPRSIATTKIDVTHMKTGDYAGLCVMQDPFASIGVYMEENGCKTIQMRIKDQIITQLTLPKNILYIRADVSAVSDLVTFFYSFDNKRFTPLGSDFKMEFNLTDFCGNRYGLFNYAEQELGGYIDIDWIRVEPVPFSKYATAQIEAEEFDHIFQAKPVIATSWGHERNQEIVFSPNGRIGFLNLKFEKKGVKHIQLYVTTDAITHLDIATDRNGKYIISRLKLPNTKGVPMRVYYPLDKVIRGVQDIYFRANSENHMCKIDWFKFF